MVNEDFIIRTFNKDHYDSIAISNATGSSLIAHCQGSKKELLDEWNQFSENCEPGKYQVKVFHSTESKGGKARNEETGPKIMLWEKKPGPDPVSHQINGGYDNNLRIELDRIKKELEEARERERKREFEDRIAEIESSAQMQTISLLKDIWQSLQHKQPTPGLAGTKYNPMANTEPKKASDTKEVLEKIAEWQEADPDFFDALCDIVNLAKNNPGKYQMGKSLLK